MAVATKLSVKEIQLALRDCSLLFDLRNDLVCPNVSWGLLPYEADLLGIKKNGIVTEVEIKRSYEDFKKDFEKYGVDTALVDVKSGFRSFASVLWLSADTTTRTCVFDKGDLPALVLNDAQIEAIKNADILMVDGNEMDAAVEAAKIARANGTKVLYDCGGLYAGVERLLALTDIMIPSEEFSLGHTGAASAEEAAKKLYETYSPEVVVVTQGKKGGIIYDGKEIVSYPIYPAVVVDSNGSGDVFHGTFAAAVCKGYDYIKCCHFSSAVSGLKCTGVGARESVPDFETVKKYMKENGYEL